MAILHGKQGLLCDKDVSVKLLAWGFTKYSRLFSYMYFNLVFSFSKHMLPSPLKQKRPTLLLLKLIEQTCSIVGGKSRVQYTTSCPKEKCSQIMQNKHLDITQQQNNGPIKFKTNLQGSELRCWSIDGHAHTYIPSKAGQTMDNSHTTYKKTIISMQQYFKR